MGHWSDDLSLYEALHVGDLVGYEPDSTVADKSDYILSLACSLIKRPYSTLATAYDTVHHFMVRARNAVARG